MPKHVYVVVNLITSIHALVFKSNIVSGSVPVLVLLYRLGSKLVPYYDLVVKLNAGFGLGRPGYHTSLIMSAVIASQLRGQRHLLASAVHV